jgi:hypothetical protein
MRFALAQAVKRTLIDGLDGRFLSRRAEDALSVLREEF